MFNTYKNIQIVYGVIFIMLIGGALYFRLERWVVFVILVLSVMSMQRHFVKLHKRDLAGYEKIGNTIKEALESQKFIDELTVYVNTVDLHPLYKFNFEFLIANAYGDIGEIDQSIQMMKQMFEAGGNKKQNLDFSGNMCLCIAVKYGYKKDLPRAEKYRELAHKYPLHKKQQKEFDHIASRVDGYIQLLKGDGEGALTLAQNYLEHATCRLDEVLAHWLMAEIYESLGDDVQEKKHLQYVADHGNQLFIAQKACQKLSEWS